MADTIETSHSTFELPTPYVYTFTWAELFRVLMLGEVVGVLAALLAHPIQQYIIQPLVCHNSSTLSICTGQTELSFSIGAFLLSVAAMLVLAGLQMYQPLLVALAPLIALWGLDQRLQELYTNHLPVFVVFAGLLFALAYGAFYLLLRMRALVISIMLTAIAVVGVRLLF
jgi:hypothetical protein